MYTYMVQTSLQNSSGKVVFFGGPLGTSESKSTWSLKSVKEYHLVSFNLFSSMQLVNDGA